MEPRRGARQKLKPRRIVNDTTSRWPAIHAYGERSRPFVPSNVPYETERRGNGLFWNSRTMDPTRKSGI
jgi:hypothetical protein